MKAVTVRQPWASLIAAGVKTIETRPRRTGYRGRIAIHAAARWEPGWRGWVNPDHPDDPAVQRHDLLIEHLRGDPIEAANDPRYWTVDVRHLPLGAVVASAVLTNCVPIVGAWPDSFEPYVYVEGGAQPWRLALWANSQKHMGIDVSDQLAFGDFLPGRWALLLDDIKPTTERCPQCWGDPVYHGLGCDLCQGKGMCDPVPARGQQAVPWEWQPTVPPTGSGSARGHHPNGARS